MTAAAQTFLDLVNNAIYETKAELDPLSSGTFASPPRTTLYTRFKNWVNMGYRELLMKRKEWYFRSERATVSVWPRLHLAGLTATLAAGDILVGQSSGVQFTIKGVYNFEDVENDSANESTVEVEAVSGYDLRNLILAENFDRTNNTPVSGVAVLKGLGQYSFTDLITNLESIDMNSVHASKIPSEAVTAGTNISTNDVRLIPVKWADWSDAVNSYNYTNWLADMPVYITQTPQGKYELYPQPEGNILLSFDFTSGLPSLVTYSDVPVQIPTQYHDYLMWRAVQEYADFDNQSKLYLRATKHVEEYLYFMNRDMLPKPSFGCSKF